MPITVEAGFFLGFPLLFSVAVNPLFCTVCEDPAISSYFYVLHDYYFSLFPYTDRFCRIIINLCINLYAESSLSQRFRYEVR